MTIPDFIASLPSDPSRAIAEIDGALAFDGVGHAMSAYDRALLERERKRLRDGRKPQ